MGDAPPDTDTDTHTPGMREYHALAAAATSALVGIEELVGTGVPDKGKAGRYGIRLRAMRTELRNLAGELAEAGIPHDAPPRGRETFLVYAVEATFDGPRRRSKPFREDFTSWAEFLAFLAEAIQDIRTVTIRVKLVAAEGSSACPWLPRYPAPQQR